jgi:anti-sigma factor RsiW
MTTPDLGGLTCKEVVELVTDYLEDSLSAEMRNRFERHLTACDPCVTYLDQMRQTIAAIGKLPEESISQPVLDTLLEHFRGWSRERA